MDQLSAPNTPSNSSAAGTSSSSPRRRARLQRSERLHSESNTPYSSWEALVRDTFGSLAWPIKITSWELVADAGDVVPTRYVKIFLILFTFYLKRKKEKKKSLLLG